MANIEPQYCYVHCVTAALLFETDDQIDLWKELVC